MVQKYTRSITFEDSTRLAEKAPPGRVIHAASAENTFSYEYASLQHGDFAYYFVVEGINKGYVDRWYKYPRLTAFFAEGIC